jgi:hypothetical protein
MGLYTLKYAYILKLIGLCHVAVSIWMNSIEQEEEILSGGTKECLDYEFESVRYAHVHMHMRYTCITHISLLTSSEIGEK